MLSHTRTMNRPTLITICKSRSGKPLQIGPATEWDRIREGFVDLDYIDLYCVTEFAEVLWEYDVELPDVWVPDIWSIMNIAIDYVKTRHHLCQILPTSPERARIARQLLQVVLDL